MSSRAQPGSGAVKFPGSKLSAVAFAAVLLGGATAWIGARDERFAAADARPQPATAPVNAPQRLGPNGGYARAGNAPATRPQPTTRTRAS